MKYLKHLLIIFGFGILFLFKPAAVSGQDLPIRYATLELFTNTPCPICASQNPGLFNRLANYEGQYHLIGFYPGSPYSSCIFYQANIPQNTARVQHYSGEIFGSPTVALNGIDFKSSSGVNTTVLDNLTGGTSWLYIDVEETTGTSRTVTINLQDVVGGSLNTGRLYAAIVEKEINYNAPNGETLHHNVFRRFLTDVNGEDVDLTSGQATRSYNYDVSNGWNADETYVIAWLMDTGTKEIYNSGTRFDADFTSANNPVQPLSALSIFPNPARTEVNITLPSGVNEADIEIYDPQGRLVRSSPSSQGPQIQLTTADFLPGKYFIRLTSGRDIYTGAFDVVK
jgi:hypothetical protein